MPRRSLLDKLTRRQILEKLRVGRHHHLYVLGRPDLQVSVYSQQVRAINLLHAIADCADVHPARSRIAVVGGGAAGLTAAATAGWLGFRDVTLFEQGTEILNTFRENTKRFLHPHMYEWPKPEWSRRRAGLPILDWEAGTPQCVAKQIATSWEAFRQTFAIKKPDYTQSLVRGVQRLRKHNDPLRLRFRSGTDQHFDVVILALGFGRERDLEGSAGYWRDDDYESTQEDHEHPVYLVSGCGDGGLIDYLRLRLRNFSQGSLIERFLPDGDKEVEAAKVSLLDIEQELWAARLPPQANPKADRATQRWLFERYWDINASDIRGRIESDRRRGAFAYLTSREGISPLQPGAFILNRFLALQVLRVDGLVPDAHTGLPLAAESAYGRLWPHHPPPEGVHFKMVIRRHGPESALKERFPHIDRQISRQRFPRHNDTTRSPAWKKGENAAEASLRSALTQAVLGSGDLLDLVSRLLRVRMDEDWTGCQYPDIGGSNKFIGSRTALAEMFRPLSDQPTWREKEHLIKGLSRHWCECGWALATADLAIIVIQDVLRVPLLLLFAERIQRAGGTGLSVEPGSFLPVHPKPPDAEIDEREGVPRLRSVARLPSLKDYEVQFVWHSDLPDVRSAGDVGVLVPNADHQHLSLGTNRSGWTAQLVDPENQLRALLDLLGGLDAVPTALVMPELSSDPRVVAGLEAWLRSRGRPAVFAAGSYHTHGASAAPVGHEATLLIASSTAVARYSCPKSTRCRLGELEGEGKRREVPRLIVHLSLRSSIACIVCGDMNDPLMRQLLEALQLRLILVPACRNSPLKDSAHQLARSQGSVVAVAYAPLPASEAAAATAAYVVGSPPKPKSVDYPSAPMIFVP